ncbi:hypothetical protein HPP92_009752 [Vanilla planifolia]|uniref:RNA-binding protein Tab2-like N-terminal domain-containing protein n=1 Tax=Vanilla planifolia TaxID=51239 RepID=A0A835RFZ5_VANPL|nr:hypothetical protein HPP92_009752 [Vanilla planifolia]
MATIGFQSPRIRMLQCHSQVSPISHPRFLSIPYMYSPRVHATAPLDRRLSVVPRASSVSYPSSSVVSESGETEEFDPEEEVRFLDVDVESKGSITEWELDFCSRPILDERGKKVWELVVCDASLSLQYTRYFPNNVINSVTLRDAITSITSDLGVSLPTKIRFFRFTLRLPLLRVNLTLI